jgi:hypothetical protein
MNKTSQHKKRPYRVFKETGKYFVKINDKRVYIVHKHRKGKEKTGERQIVRGVVNNLLAQQRTRRKRKTKKPALVIKAPSSDQPANGKSVSNGQVDVTNIPDSKTAEQTPTVDSLYANAGKKPPVPPIENAVPDYKQGEKEDMLNAYILGQNNLLFAQGILSGKNGVSGPIVVTDETVAPDLPPVLNVMSEIDQKKADESLQWDENDRA